MSGAGEGDRRQGAPPPVLVDSHCHLDFPDFAPDLDAVLARARAAGVRRIVTISTRVARADALRALAEAHEDVFFTVGTHPHNAAEEDGLPVERLLALAAHPKCVGIGEAGLDYHHKHAPREAQARGLRAHAEAARRAGLPLVVHARDADEDVVAILREECGKGPLKGVLHCYSSGPALAEAGLALGFHLSFSGIVTFKASGALRAIAAAAPLDRLLVETDAPYLAPAPRRGGRNEPARVADTARALADLRGLSLEALAAATTANALRLFDRMPPP